MEIKVNGACNWDTTDTTGIKTVQLHIPKWVCVRACNQRNHRKLRKLCSKEKLTRLGLW